MAAPERLQLQSGSRAALSGDLSSAVGLVVVSRYYAPPGLPKPIPNRAGNAA